MLQAAAEAWTCAFPTKEKQSAARKLIAAIGKLDMAPALGTVIAGLTRDGRHQELLDDGMRALIGILNRPSTRELIAELITSWLKREHAAMELVLTLVERHQDNLAIIGSSLGGFYATWLAERFGCSGPFWSRHYRFFRQGRELTVIREVFSPLLETWLGPAAGRAAATECDDIS